MPKERADRASPILLDNNHQFNEIYSTIKHLLAKTSSEKKKLPVKEALPMIEEVEVEKLLDGSDVVREAIALVEESGIVFIDEVDKICSNNEYKGADASAEGVQRDLLPLIEGSTVSTKFGNVKTDFILFIASGAFHSSKPSELLAELQGRLPIRVELKGLTEDDLFKILTTPVNNLIRQQIELLATENIRLVFEQEAVLEIAKIAAEINRSVENIGARRLHTVIERIVEEISFGAADMEPGKEVRVTKALVKERLSEMLVTSDVSKYIL